MPLNTELETTGDKRLSNVYITLPMGSVVKYAMNYVCRLCGEVIDENSAVNIFLGDQFQENLVYKINKYLPIVVSSTNYVAVVIVLINGKYIFRYMKQIHFQRLFVSHVLLKSMSFMIWWRNV